MSAQKTGDWNKYRAHLMGMAKKETQMRDLVLDSSARAFQEGIQSEIRRNDVEPANKDFTADEYAQSVKIISKAHEVSIGVPKDTEIRGHDVGSFAIDAEFGFKSPRFLGIWRSFMTRFGNKMKEQMEKILRED